MNDRTFLLQAALGAAALMMTTGALVAADDECLPQWHAFGSDGQIGLGAGASPRTIAVYQGDLIVGGQFTTAGGQEVNHIVRWDGEQWHPLTSGGQIGVGGQSSAGGVAVDALAVWGDSLVVGGRFQTVGGQEVNRIALWDGQEWHPFVVSDDNGEPIYGVGALNSIVKAILVRDNDLVIGGFFITAGDEVVNNIARWANSQWHAFEVDNEIGVSSRVQSLTVWNDDLIAGGRFNTAGGTWVRRIGRWSNSFWHPLSSGGQTGVDGPSTALRVPTLIEYNGDLIVGGRFNTAGGQTVNNIARWDGTEWHPIIGSDGQIGVDSTIWGMTVWNGDLIVGGLFESAGGESVNYIARWDGELWHPFVANGEVGMPFSVRSLGHYEDDLVVGGVFNFAGGTEVNRIARWGGCADECDVVGDLNCDGVVDVSDLLILLAEWGPCPRSGDCPADLNGDGAVDVSDLLILLANWG